MGELKWVVPSDRIYFKSICLGPCELVGPGLVDAVSKLRGRHVKRGRSLAATTRSPAATMKICAQFCMRSRRL